MEPDPIKHAFAKVKQDVLNLQSQLAELKQEIQELKRTLISTTHPLLPPTHRQQTSNTSTHNLPLEAPKTENSTISTGNRGVPTDRQTDQQTGTNLEKFAQMSTNNALEEEHISKVISSINLLKADLAAKFKSLTKQEFSVFSSIYLLEQQTKNHIDYNLLSKKLSLTESSIRDYVQRIIKKGIPLIKTKENNKKILLTIPEDFKRLASLDAILSVREAEK